MALGQNDLGAITQGGVLLCREHQLREAGRHRHTSLAIHAAGGGLEFGIDLRRIERSRFDGGLFGNGHTLARIHHQGVAALACAQPSVAASAQVGRRGLGQRLQAVAETPRVTHEHRAFGQGISLATETTNTLDAANPTGFHCGAIARDLVSGRAVFEQLIELVINGRLHLRHIHALLDRSGDHEGAAQLRAIRTGADVVH